MRIHTKIPTAIAVRTPSALPLDKCEFGAASRSVCAWSNANARFALARGTQVRFWGGWRLFLGAGGGGLSVLGVFGVSVLLGT